MSTLHITNGDSVRGTLGEIVSDPIAIVADPLHEGPAPAGMEGRAWCELRARFLAGESDEYEDVLRWLSEWEAAVPRTKMYDEVVLWFEHDLFDQLILIRLLDRLVRLKPDATTDKAAAAGIDTGVASGFSRTLPEISMICIGAFPGVDRFVGLGQLTADQLASLVGERRSVTEQQYSLARDAWAAFGANHPTTLTRLASELTGDAALPFLGDALTRFLQEYPSTVNGLSRSANAVLQSLMSAPLSGHELFARTQAREPRPFMGDLTVYRIVEQLAGQRVPLLTVERAHKGEPLAAELSQARITLTQAGRDVAAGRQDAVALNGIDEWRGGVHLQGTDRSPWRWDPAAETLVS